MNQKIDFYERIGKERLIPKSVLILCLSWVSVFVLYGVWAGILVVDQNDSMAELKASKRQNDQLVQEINRMAQLGQSNGINALTQRLQQLHERRLKNEKFIGLLQDPRYNNLDGFSSVLVGLARQHKKGVSLSKIEVTDSGSVFSMAGTVIDPADVPAYVVRLGEEGAFTNMVFEKINILETTVGQELKFEIRSLSKS